MKNFNTQAALINLTTLLREATGMTLVLKLEQTTTRNGKPTLEITSEDLADRQVPRMFEELRVINTHIDLVEDPKHGKVWAIPLHYRYQHFRGGSNGSEITTAWVNEKGEIVGCYCPMNPKLDINS